MSEKTPTVTLTPTLSIFASGIAPAVAKEISDCYFEQFLSDGNVQRQQRETMERIYGDLRILGINPSTR